MNVILLVAGLTTDIHEHLARQPLKRFVPNGIMLARPIGRSGSYPKEHAGAYVRMAHDYVASLPEASRVSVVIAYVDYGETTTTTFLENFFPFALPRPLIPVSFEGITNPQTKRSRLSEYMDYVASESRALIDKARAVAQETSVANLTPLLLPLGNFRGAAFRPMLQRLYGSLGREVDPRSALNVAVREFLRRYPRVHPDSKEGRHCLSDNVLFFKSPGRHRHGYYRHKTDKEHHPPTCLLNARSRLGGHYDHTFHFDCSPTHGRLASSYPNCHNESCAPKAAHVNIAPNDYVI